MVTRLRSLPACILGLLVVVLNAVSPGPAAAQTAPDCVFAAHYPPLMIQTGTEASGISIDVMREAAARAGRQIAIEFMPFQRALYSLNVRSDCMMAALFRNASRETDFQWIETYHAAELSFMTIEKRIDALEDGRKLARIAVETDASADQFLTSNGFDNLLRIPGLPSSAQMLQSGRIDAWVQSPRAAQKVWDQLGLEPALLTGTPIYSVPIYVTAGLDYPPEIANAYAKAIRTMLADGTVAEILDRYD